VRLSQIFLPLPADFLACKLLCGALASPTTTWAFVPRVTLVPVPIVLVKGFGGLLSQVTVVPLVMQSDPRRYGERAAEQQREQDNAPGMAEGARMERLMARRGPCWATRHPE
jgi:hypothetical protein